MSHHENSHSSWSLMCRDLRVEVLAHYGCDIWGLERSLGSYVSSFITTKFYTKKRKPRLCPLIISVLDYTEVGLILIYKRLFPNAAYYVANPVTRQCIKIPPIATLLLACDESEQFFHKARLVTRANDNGVVSGYKVVLIEKKYKRSKSFVTFIIYSSETGFWSSKTIYSPLSLILKHRESITLNGNLHWLGHQDVVVSFDFYGSDHQFLVTPFPDSDKEPSFKRCCSTSQGNLMYMNIVSENKVDGSVEHKLSAWTLKNGEWQLVCEISPDFIKTGSDYLPLAINPFDGVTMYIWSKMYESLASINLRSTVHNVLARSSINALISDSYVSMFVLPRWLYRIPQPPCLEEFIDIPRN